MPTREQSPRSGLAWGRLCRPSRCRSSSQVCRSAYSQERHDAAVVRQGVQGTRADHRDSVHQRRIDTELRGLTHVRLPERIESDAHPPDAEPVASSTGDASWKTESPSIRRKLGRQSGNSPGRWSAGPVTNLAISLCVVSALLVMVAIATLFLTAYARYPPVLPIAVVFAGSLGARLVGLLCFLREVCLATESLRTHVEYAPGPTSPGRDRRLKLVAFAATEYASGVVLDHHQRTGRGILPPLFKLR